MPIDRTVSADARHATEKCVARDLTGNKTAVELQNNFVAADFAQVIGISQATIDHAQAARRKLERREKFCAGAPIAIENGDAPLRPRAQVASQKQRGKMISRRHIKFAGADKNSGTILRRARKIPSHIANRIRRRDKGHVLRRVLAAKGTKNFRRFRRCAETTVCHCNN